MLLANMAAARRIYVAFPSFALLRQHDAPNEKKLQQSVQVLAAEGFDLHVTRSVLIGRVRAACSPTSPSIGAAVSTSKRR